MSVRKEELLFVCRLTEKKNKKPFASKKLRYVLLAVSISPQLVLEEKPPRCFLRASQPSPCPQNPYFPLP